MPPTQRKGGKISWQINFIGQEIRWIAGVCGGIAEYFGLAPKIVRIICALFIMIYGSGLMIYIILAIFIPKEPKR